VDDLAALTYQFEHLFLKKIIEGLRNKTISIVQAKEYANAFLAIEPFTSTEDAGKKIMEFTTQHAMFSELKSHMITYQNEISDLAKIAKMREYIKQNNIDAALAVAKT
jgi:hypothetical protein